MNYSRQSSQLWKRYKRSWTHKRQSMGLGWGRNCHPGSAVRHTSVVRHVSDCLTRPGINSQETTFNKLLVDKSPIHGQPSTNVQERFCGGQMTVQLSTPRQSHNGIPVDELDFNWASSQENLSSGYPPK